MVLLQAAFAARTASESVAAGAADTGAVGVGFVSDGSANTRPNRSPDKRLPTIITPRHPRIVSTRVEAEDDLMDGTPANDSEWVRARNAIQTATALRDTKFGPNSADREARRR
jgi:hypothetical protein